MVGQGHIGQNVMLACVHQVGQLEPARQRQFGHFGPGFAGMGAVEPVEGLADRGGGDGVLTP